VKHSRIDLFENYIKGVMGSMSELLDMQAWMQFAVMLNFILVIIILILTLVNFTKIRRLKAKYKSFMSGSDAVNIEELLEECIKRVNNVNIKNKEIENKINGVERNVLNCIQKVGIVRYNAFDNVGSDLSFSIALLDSNDDGVVLSGLYSRESSSTYAKPISSGNSKYVLSAEEIKAIDVAKKIYNEKPYIGRLNN
jgi:hypothetical protein